MLPPLSLPLLYHPHSNTHTYMQKEKPDRRVTKLLRVVILKERMWVEIIEDINVLYHTCYYNEYILLILYTNTYKCVYDYIYI